MIIIKNQNLEAKSRNTIKLNYYSIEARNKFKSVFELTQNTRQIVMQFNGPHRRAKKTHVKLTIYLTVNSES